MHPKAKSTLNNIYNGHYTGSQLWKMGSREYEKVLSTYNKSVKIMFDLPWATHRSLIEPLTGTQHVSRMLVKRYLSFIDKIDKSSKTTLRQLLGLVRNDVRLTTGHNLRTIMMILGKNSIDELDCITADFEYHKIEENEHWKVNMVKELVDIKAGDLGVHGMKHEEVQQILEFICTS